MNVDVPVLIVGAGPYGLSLAAHLRARKVPYRIVGLPMYNWDHHMPDGMLLKSEGFASSIDDPAATHTLARFCAEVGYEYGDYGVPVPIDVFRRYGHWFQEQLVPTAEQGCVVGVKPDSHGFSIELESGETFSAGRVVVAVGLTFFAFTPAELDALPRSMLTHTSDHSNFDGFAGRSVAVIGAGQSALETAALLQEHDANVTLIVRKPSVAWNPPPDLSSRTWRERARRPIAALGPGWRAWFLSSAPRSVARLPSRTRLRLYKETLGPAGAWWLRERLDAPILMNHHIVGARIRDGKPIVQVCKGATEMDLAVDHVIAATGYRVNVHRLPFLAPAVAHDVRTLGGLPVLDRGLSSSVPGLHFNGIMAAAAYGPMMRFVWGTRHSSRALARALS
ncbi:MAG TPA: NAD(P)-binding domain-containing protein [Acidimicrobiia bacterium]|nr:NAD(P)-binding domain-containing protein [Acidimicrobiia bacterium]